MTPAQKQLYWREWAAVRRVKPDADRHALHRQALGGRDESSTAFSNEDFDAVLATFRAISRPSDMRAQLRQQVQPRARQLHALNQVIRCLGVYVDDPIAYVIGVVEDKFRNAHTLKDLGDKPYEWTDRSTGQQRVAPSQLDQLRITLWARINAAKTGLRAKRGHSLHDMYMQAEVPCFCKRCRTEAALRKAAATVTQNGGAAAAAIREQSIVDEYIPQHA